MSARLFDKARQGFVAGDLDWDAHTIRGMLLDCNTVDTFVRAITGATNATPIVITSTAHGFDNDDIVVIGAVGGNLAANGTYRVANQAANTFELRTLDGQNVVGSGVYTSGGYAVNLTKSQFVDAFSAGRVGSDVALASKTNSNGTVDAADLTFTAVTGATVEACLIYRDTGVEATSQVIAFLDGRTLVTCASTVSSGATSIPVERLTSAISSGASLVFSNGVTATLTAPAAVGDRTLAVSALAAGIAAGHTADAPRSGTTFPVTPNGGDITVQFDAQGIFRL